MPAIILRFILPALVIVGLTSGIYLAGYKAASHKYQAEMSQEKAARDAIVILKQQEAKYSEQKMAESEASRIALAGLLDQRITDNNGLAGRLSAAQARLRTSPVPTAEGDNHPTAGKPQDSCSTERLNTVLQQHIDACRKDGIALSALTSKPVCECP